jgi:hypothetical protein
MERSSENLICGLCQAWKMGSIVDIVRMVGTERSTDNEHAEMLSRGEFAEKVRGF